jgi:hypothetical protein
VAVVHHHLFGLNYATGGNTSAIYDTSGNGSMNSADQAANAMTSNGIPPEGPAGECQRQSYICTVGSAGTIACTAAAQYSTMYGRLSWREIIQSW